MFIKWKGSDKSFQPHSVTGMVSIDFLYRSVEKYVFLSKYLETSGLFHLFFELYFQAKQRCFALEHRNREIASTQSKQVQFNLEITFVLPSLRNWTQHDYVPNYFSFRTCWCVCLLGAL